MSLATDKKLYLAASDFYYNGRGKTKMSDDKFDVLEQSIRAQDPKWEHLAKTGAPVRKQAVELEHFMPSLAKYYPDRINKWVKADTEYLIMDKLDGCSLQLTYDNGRPVKAVTRGDGTIGKDVSYLIPFLRIPKKIKNVKHQVFRCEAVMPKGVFLLRHSVEFENARAAVNGMFNRLSPHKGLKDVDIVVLGIYFHSMETALDLAASWGFTVVPSVVRQFNEKHLNARKLASDYEIDGLVLCHPAAALIYKNADRPKFMVAFKENVEGTAVKVVDVIWQDSANSRLIPKIQIEPTKVDGTTITYVAAHNAQMLMDKGIGPGAVVKIVRSGGVIPFITEVVKKGKTKYPAVDYEVKGVHFVALKRSKEADVRALLNFFQAIGVEFLASKTISTVYDNALVTTLDYLKHWKDGELETVLIKCGVGTKNSAKIAHEFTRVLSAGVPMITLMVASNCFDPGLGARKLNALELACPGILPEMVKEPTFYHEERICAVKGFSEKTADLITRGMPKFRTWLAEALKYIKVAKPKSTQAVDGPLTDQLISFTGYRNKEHEAFVIAKGGQVVSYGTRTTILVYKAGGKVSSKVETAKARGQKVTTFTKLEAACNS